MAYADLVTIQATDPGDILTAAWCDQVRDNDEFLIDPPACSISDVAQSVSNNTTTTLGGTATESFDNDSMHSNVSNRSRITAQTAGRYLLISSVAFTANPTGFRRSSFLVDGTTAIGGMTIEPDDGVANLRLTSARAVVLSAGQYVEVTCLHTGGFAIDCTLDEFVAIFLTR